MTKTSHKLNQAKITNDIDLYRLIIRQNRILYTLLFIFLLSYSAVLAALLLRPTPILMVDTEGRYTAEVSYKTSPTVGNGELETLVKRFVQHYLSQNSATIYADAELSLAAMCPPLRKSTHAEWVDGGRLGRIVERVQVSRILFSDFEILKYLTADDIQTEVAGRVIVAGDQSGDVESEFRLHLTMKLAPLTSRNYLGLEVCDIKFL